MKQLLITIDGPAGAGKTTVSRSLAKRLQYAYVDTGALYRGIALEAFRRNCMPDNDECLSKICEEISLNFKPGKAGSRLLLNGVDVSEQIRTQEIGMLASAVSARPAVRKHLLELQRNLGQEGAVVFEGRDMGTAVFPNADVKFFLDAAPAARGLRRYNELIGNGIEASLDEVTEAIQKRDCNDASRPLAPLKAAEDAIAIDSTSMEVDEVVDIMLKHIAARKK